MKKILNFKFLVLTALLFGAFGCQKDEYEINYLVDYVGIVQDNSTREAIGGVTITYGDPETSITAGADGTFLIPNLKSGIYEFHFKKDGYAISSYKTTVQWEAEYGQLTSPKKGAHVNQIQGDFDLYDGVALYPLGAELKGKVLKKDGTTPYVDVKVVFEPDYSYGLGKFSTTSNTGADGSYQITNLPERVYGTLKAYSGSTFLGSAPIYLSKGENPQDITEE